MNDHLRRLGETWEQYVARRNPPRESGLCPLCWPEHERRSLWPPYGACAVCVVAEAQSVGAVRAAGPRGGAR